MKVWVLRHGNITVYSEDTDVLDLPYVRYELSFLVGSYAEEREEFIAEIDRIKQRGGGTVSIEERFDLELMEVK